MDAALEHVALVFVICAVEDAAVATYVATLPSSATSALGDVNRYISATAFHFNVDRATGVA
jgi:hypothetical protein